MRSSTIREKCGVFGVSSPNEDAFNASTPFLETSTPSAEYLLEFMKRSHII
ncbi:MAG: hypothetical protein ACP5HX_03495 [Thermoproteota archaeon]